MKPRGWPLLFLLLFAPMIWGALPPTPGGVLTVSLSRSLSSLDPLFVSTPEEATLSRQVYDTLFVETSGGVESRVLYRWREENDGKALHLWLKPTVAFHDGSLLGAEDVKASLQRALVLGRHQPEAALLDAIQGAEVLRHNPASRLDGVQVDNRLELTFWLVRPDPDLPRKLAHPRFGLVPARSLAQSDPRTPPPGSGPFTLRALRDDQLQLVAFDRNTQGRPFFDRVDVTWRRVAAPDVAWTMQPKGALQSEVILRAMNEGGKAYLPLVRHHVQCAKALALLAPLSAKADATACKAFSFSRERTLAALPAAQRAQALTLAVATEEETLNLWARRIQAELSALNLAVTVENVGSANASAPALLRVERRLVGYPYPDDDRTLRLYGDAMALTDPSNPILVIPQDPARSLDLAWWWRRMDDDAN